MPRPGGCWLLGPHQHHHHCPNTFDQILNSNQLVISALYRLTPPPLPISWWSCPSPVFVFIQITERRSWTGGGATHPFPPHTQGLHLSLNIRCTHCSTALWLFWFIKNPKEWQSINILESLPFSLSIPSSPIIDVNVHNKVQSYQCRLQFSG